MKRIWKHKWLVIAGSLVMFLSIGAAAWAVSGGQPAASGTVLVADNTTATTLAPGSGAPADGTVAQLRQKIKQKRDAFIKRQEALMQHLREEMTPADQALYDQLVAAAKQQRDELRQIREKLTDTLKQLRDLRDKYLDAAPTTAG